MPSRPEENAWAAMYCAQHIAVMAFSLCGLPTASRRFSSTICAARRASGITEGMATRFV